MPIETICQGCARKLRVPDSHAGKKARCPQCGLIYVVPGTPVAETPAESTERAAQLDALPPTNVLPETTWAGERLQPRWRLRTADGRVYGPVPRSELDQWFAEGRIPADAAVLCESESHWRSASEIYPQLTTHSRLLNERHNPFAESASPFRATGPARYLAPHRGGVILTLAILGWALCPVLGPIAWVMALNDLRAMRTGQMDPSGQSLTKAGMVLGMIATILTAIIFFLACLGIFG